MDFLLKTIWDLITIYMEFWQTIIGIIIGGLLAIVGGIAGIYLQAKKARKIKMDEIIALRMVDASAKGYSVLERVRSMHIQCSLNDTVAELLKHEAWFFNNRLFLPGKFSSYWLAGRNKLIKLQRMEKDPNGDKKMLTQLASEIDETLDKAILEIHKEMDLERINLSVET